MKKFFAILIMCSLTLPVFSIDEQEAWGTSSNENIVETVQPEAASDQDTNITENELAPIREDSFSSQYKQPTSKKKLAKKFIIAMLCVAGASVFIYITLNIYNKIRDGLTADTTIPPEGEKPLDAPSDITEAVKTFIEKTKWN